MCALCVGPSHKYEKCYNIYFVVMCGFNLQDIIYHMMDVNSFTLKMSLARMTFIIVTTYYNIVWLFLASHYIISLYHLLFIIDVFITLKYIILVERRKHEEKKKEA
jgi:hypothetical protein